MKYGRKPYTHDKRDLLYRNYRGAGLPPIPASFGHQDLVTDWGMLANDTVGDCVIAGADHAAMLWTKEGSAEARFTDANALADYSAITGYNPNDPNSDQGTNIRTALLYQQQTGMIDATGKRHKIGAFLALDVTNLDEVLEALYLFSVIKIGIAVPSTAETQFAAGQPWTVEESYSYLGGHDVEIVGWDGEWLYVVTWGKVQKMSVNFFRTFCDEAWVVLSPEFLNGQGKSPEGFDLSQLQADLAAISSVPKSQTTVVFTVSSSIMQVNGQPVQMNTVPALEDNRMFIPVRYMGDVLEADTAWNQDSQEVVIMAGGTRVILTVGSTDYLVNDMPQTMDTAPYEDSNSRVMVPIRFVAQAFGATVDYDGTKQAVTITL